MLLVVIKIKFNVPNASVDGDMGLVSEVTVSFFDEEIEIRARRFIPQFLPVDAVLNFQLQDGLSSSSTNNIHMAPNIRNLIYQEFS